MATELSITFCLIDRVALPPRARTCTNRADSDAPFMWNEREIAIPCHYFTYLKFQIVRSREESEEGGTGPACDWSMWPANGGRRGCDLNKSGLRISRGRQCCISPAAAI